MTNESVNIVDSERWFKIGSCGEASRVFFFDSFNAFQGTYCNSRNLCGFPLVDVDQQKDSKTKKKLVDVKNGCFQSIFKHGIFL